MATQFLPAIATTAAPLYSKICRQQCWSEFQTAGSRLGGLSRPWTLIYSGEAVQLTDIAQACKPYA